jgi:hypothetical protein
MIIYATGFDADSSLPLTGWSVVEGGISSPGRFGGQYAYSLQRAAQRTMSHTIPASPNIGACVAFNFPVLSTQQIIRFIGDGASHTDVRISAGKLIITLGGTLLATGTTTIVANTWYQIEFYTEVHDTSGTASVWLNGDAVPEVTFSGDTKGGGTGVIDTIFFASGQAVNGAVDKWDDLVVYDTTGSVNNAPQLGDLRCTAFYPNGDGTASQLVGSDGNSTNNYLLVDETTPNDDTDYVQTATIGNKDTYQFDNLGATAGGVLAVQTKLWAKKTGAGTREIVPVLKLGGTEVDGTSISLGVSYGRYDEIQEEKPGGGIWSASDFNGTEFGVKLIT